jgi:IS605 OrfB family transposase
MYKKVYAKQDQLRSHRDTSRMTKRQFKKAWRRRADKIKNRIADLHWKSAKFLCERFDRIVIGKLSTKEAISKKQDLPAYVKRVLLTLSHYEYRQKLICQAEKYGSIVVEMDEDLTTKTCSNCGNVKNMKLLKVYDCPACKKKMGRDHNASRNIYAKKEEE